METRTYTAKFKVGDKCRYIGTTDGFRDFTMTVTRIVFPGDILYENYGLANGTGAIVYKVKLDKPLHGVTDYQFFGTELAVV